MWFLNAPLLFALGGLALPVLAHLLSRKKYEVVKWGAMQFLQLGRQTQRRVLLEEWLLMLLRMGLIALVVFALARPWINSGWLAGYTATKNRDLVLILDGSGSMGWEGPARTVQADAVQIAHQFLETLKPGDHLTLLESRDVIRSLVAPATTDQQRIRAALSEVPPPAGQADWPTAIGQGLRALSRGAHPTRDLVVFTDLQALGWHPDEPVTWDLIAEQRLQPQIVPRLWVVNVSGSTSSTARENFSLERIRLSREFTVPDLPVRIETKLRHRGGTAAQARTITLEIDGSRLADATLTSPAIPVGGEYNVQFEHRFTKPGLYRLSVALERDQLPSDDRAEALIEVLPALPALIVEGDPQLDPTRSEAFFLNAALQAGGESSPLVTTRTLPIAQFTSETLTGQRVVILANVPRFTPEQIAALQAFADRGGGVWFALGDKIDAAHYRTLLFADGQGLLPANVTQQGNLPPGTDGLPPAPVTLENRSLQAPWLAPFRQEQQGTLITARFDHWWEMAVPEPAAAGETAPPTAVLATLSNGHPWMLERPWGRGRVLCLTTPVDADWSTLPTKFDYVPWLHETLFHLAQTGTVTRRVQVGESLILPLPADYAAGKYVFQGPGQLVLPPVVAGDELQPLAKLDDTSVAGLYRLLPAVNGQPVPGATGEICLVESSRDESDLTPLTAEQQTALTTDGRLRIVNSLEELQQHLYGDEAQTELWPCLLLGVLLLLASEVWMTRRLVQGGHAALPETDGLPVGA